MLFHRAPVLLWFLVLQFLCPLSVVHAQWEPDVRLSFSDSTSCTSLNNTRCVAASENMIHTVWWDSLTGYAQIYYKRSTDGGSSWGPTTALTMNFYSSFDPSIAVTDSNVHVAWMDFMSDVEKIFYKRSSDNGAHWSPAVRLSPSSFAAIPSIAVSGLQVHVVWDDYRSGAWQVYYKRSTDGGVSWDPEIHLSDSVVFSYYPSVSASGSYVMSVWEGYLGGNEDIYYTRSTDGGATWQPYTHLTNTGGAYAPCVASSDSSVHVVWYDGASGAYEIFDKRSENGGASWWPDQRLTYNSALSYNPSVAISYSKVHVVWYDHRDGNWEIYYKRSNDGGVTWEPDTRLTTYTGRSLYASVTGSGPDVHVIWTDERDGNWEVYYKRYLFGNNVSETQQETSDISLKSIRLVPNPFTTFATLPGHSSDHFSLYDISGRRVGVFKGDKIGLGLSAGIYFLKPEGKDSKPLRIVKLR